MLLAKTSYTSPSAWALVVLVTLSGCFSQERCAPALMGPAGDWDFVALQRGVVMTNRLWDGWQRVKGAMPAEYEYPGYDRPWMLLRGRPASYGLRFLASSTGACDPTWASVSVDGEALPTRTMRRTVVRTACDGCAPDDWYEVVDDVVFDWTPPAAGPSSVRFGWGQFETTLHLLIAEEEQLPPFDRIPARCRRVQRFQDDTLLCDRATYRRGVRLQTWPDTSLIERLEAGAALEWGGDGKLRVWRFDGGLARLEEEFDAGVAPRNRWRDGEASEATADGIVLLPDGGVALDAQEGLLLATYVPGRPLQAQWRASSATLGVVRGSLVSLHQDGDPRQWRVCLGLEPGDASCVKAAGSPVAFGDEGVWFTPGWGSTALSLVSIAKGEAMPSLRPSQMVAAENLVAPVDTSMLTAVNVVPAADGGTGLHGNWKRARAQTLQGGCLFYEPETDATALVPRLFPEPDAFVRPDPWPAFSVPTLGDGEGDLRWCTRRSDNTTAVYLAPGAR